MWPFKPKPLLGTTGEPIIAQKATRRERKTETEHYGQMLSDQHLAKFGIQPGSDHLGPQFDSDAPVGDQV